MLFWKLIILSHLAAVIIWIICSLLSYRKLYQKCTKLQKNYILLLDDFQKTKIQEGLLNIELSQKNSQLCEMEKKLNSERELTGKLQEEVKALEAENSQLNKDLLEAQNKLKTAHNNLRIMMIEYNRWKKGEK